VAAFAPTDRILRDSKIIVKTAKTTIVTDVANSPVSNVITISLTFHRKHFPLLTPKVPDKRLITAEDRDFKRSPDKEPLWVDDTLIRADQSAGVALFSLHVGAHIRKIGGRDLPHVAHFQVSLDA